MWYLVRTGTSDLTSGFVCITYVTRDCADVADLDCVAVLFAFETRYLSVQSGDKTRHEDLLPPLPPSSRLATVPQPVVGHGCLQSTVLQTLSEVWAMEAPVASQHNQITHSL